ncbi:MAG: GYF domain-containing protein, partial [Planctomycetaceae bacterium]
MADQWYYRLFGTEFGPVSRSALDNLIQSSQLNHNDEIRAEGAPAWGRVRDLFAPQTGATSANGPNTPTESLSASTPASAEQWFYQTLGHDFGPVAFHE